MLNIQCCCMGFPNVEHRSDVVAWDFLMLNIQCCCMGFPNV